MYEVLGLLALPGLLASVALTVVGIARRSWVALLVAALCSYPMAMSAIGLQTEALTFAQLGTALGFRWRWHWLGTCVAAVVSGGAYVALIAGIHSGLLQAGR